MDPGKSGVILKCPKCHKVILIETINSGVNHVSMLIATCWICLTPEDQVRVKGIYPVFNGADS